MSRLPLHTSQPLYKILKRENGLPYGAIEDQAEKKPNIPDISQELGSLRSFETHVSQAEEDLRQAKSDQNLQELHKAEMEEEKLAQELVDAAEAVAGIKKMMEDATRKVNSSTGKECVEYMDEALFLRTAYLITLNRFEEYKSELFKMVRMSFMMSNTADKEARQEAEEIKQKIENAPDLVHQLSDVAESKGFPASNPISNMNKIHQQMEKKI
jgi:hypothetical protein